MSLRRRWLGATAILLTVLALKAAGWVVVRGRELQALPGAPRGLLGDAALPEGFALGNGRIEATEVDVATKLP